MRRAQLGITCVIGLSLVPVAATARVDHIEVLRRADVAGGRAFGDAGAYEEITARVHFKIRADHPRNRGIVDLGRAPRDKAGDVAFVSDLRLWRPKQADRGNGALLVYLPNRGRPAVLTNFNRASASEPLGDGFLFRRGFVVAELGWQADARVAADSFHLEAPIATDAAGPLRGVVRADFMAVERALHWPLGDLRGHVAGTELRGFFGGTGYVADQPNSAEHTLTVRDSPDGARRLIPRAEWSFARVVDGKPVPDPAFVHLPAGFQPGKFYEVIFRARDPRVVGVGFAALRDFAAYAKHGPGDILAAKRAHAFGISQCGRFLRHFLFEGWNADEEGRRALDGVMPDVGGAGRGEFNHRFAQPSRDAQPVASRLHVVDLFPFTDLPQKDPVSGRRGGLLDKAVATKTLPKIFYINTSNEYWGRAAALIHTSADGRSDVKIPADVRIYSLAGLQHTNGTFPPKNTDVASGTGVHAVGIVDKRPVLRALLIALDAWVKDGKQPPASLYPRLADRTLVPADRLAFPAIPGVVVPKRIHRVLRLDYGPRFAEGIVEIEPPKEVGPPYPVLLPQVDRDGNELGGLRLPELTVPIATHTGWNLRAPQTAAPEERLAYSGAYLPFAKNADERKRSGDPRPSITERYGGRDDYLRRYEAAARALARGGYVLDEDVPAIVRRGGEQWDVATKATSEASSR